MRILFFLILSILFQLVVAQDRWDFRNINSVYDEQNPVFSPDGNTLYLIRANHPQNTGSKKDKGDIWISTWNDSIGWSEPVLAGKPLNNLGYNGVIGFLGDGGMLLYGNYTSRGQSTHGKGMSVTYRKGNKWTVPKEFDIEYYFNRADHNGISLSRNGRIMLLSLESYGTLGGEDIYVSFWAPDGSWSQPLNLGADINTRYQEMTPFLAPDNNTLFFAANGWPGYGSRDVFVSKRLDDSWKNWTKPTNLGEKVNTQGKELQFYFIDDHTAIYTSTVNSDGYGDIKAADFTQEEADSLNTLPEVIIEEIVDLEDVPELKDDPIGVIYGNVRNASTGSSINARLSVDNNQLINVKNKDIEDGSYSIT